MELIASSIRRAASAIVSGYAWSAAGLAGFTDAGEERESGALVFHPCCAVNSFAGAGSCMFGLRG